jgi:multiple sugar transport system permease protein
MAQPTVATAERVIPRRPQGFSLGRALENPQILGMIFVAPAVFLLGVFLAYPFVLGLWLSFTDTLIGGEGAFIGFRNYLFALKDSVFHLTTFNTILYTVVAVWFKLVLGLMLALVLNWDFRLKGFLRAIILLPWIVPTAFSAIVFWWLFDSTFSAITWLLMKSSLLAHRIDYLGDPNLARMSIIIANVWRGIPFFAIGFLAGLQTISPTLYEAADVDGAGDWHKFRHITLPLLGPLLAIITTFSTIWTFADFQLVWIITRGGPANATHLYGTLAFQRAIQGGAFGEGAAISNFILPVLVLSVTICYLYLRRET